MPKVPWSNGGCEIVEHGRENGVGGVRRRPAAAAFGSQYVRTAEFRRAHFVNEAGAPNPHATSSQRCSNLVVDGRHSRADDPISTLQI